MFMCFPSLCKLQFSSESVVFVNCCQFLLCLLFHLSSKEILQIHRTIEPHLNVSNRTGCFRLTLQGGGRQRTGSAGSRRVGMHLGSWWDLHACQLGGIQLLWKGKKPAKPSSCWHHSTTANHTVLFQVFSVPLCLQSFSFLNHYSQQVKCWHWTCRAGPQSNSCRSPSLALFILSCFLICLSVCLWKIEIHTLLINPDLHHTWRWSNMDGNRLRDVANLTCLF